MPFLPPFLIAAGLYVVYRAGKEIFGGGATGATPDSHETPSEVHCERLPRASANPVTRARRKPQAYWEPPPQRLVDPELKLPSGCKTDSSLPFHASSGVGEVSATSHGVEAWSTIPLPFDGYDSASGLGQQRAAIRTALERFDAAPGPLERARFGVYAAVSDTADAENRLFYNVMGERKTPWTYVSPCWPSLGFCRYRTVPRGITPQQEARYYHHYIAGPDVAERSNVDRILGTPCLDFIVPLDPLINDWTSYRVWHAVCSTLVTNGRHPQASQDSPLLFFALAVDVTLPPAMSTMQLSFKQVLDGVTTALHQHTVDLEVAARLASRAALSGAMPIERVTQLLASPVNKLLGHHPCVRMHGSGIQLNPRDEDCELAVITCRANSQAATPSFRVRLYALPYDLMKLDELLAAERSGAGVS